MCIRDRSITDVSLEQVDDCYGTADTAFVTIKNEFGSLVDFSLNNLTVNWSVTGPIATTGSLTINSGTLAVGASLDTFITSIDMSAPGIYTVSGNISSNAVNASPLNDTLTDHSTFDKKALISVDPSVDTLITTLAAMDSLKLSIQSPFFPGGAFFITEICQFRTGTGSPVGGWTAPMTLGDDYIEITGVPGSDLAGYTIEYWTTSSLGRSHTFPAGTIVGPSGTLVIGNTTSSSSPANFYYGIPSTYSFGSGTSSGRVLKDASGNIVDAVGYQGFSSYTFPASSGVTAADWSGSIAGSVSSTSGIRLEGADLNGPTNWVRSATSPQNPLSINTGIALPAPSSVAGLQWTDITNSVTLDTTPEIWVDGWTSNGLYQYEATYNTPCGPYSDTADILVLLQTLDTMPFTVCDSFVTPTGGVSHFTSGFYYDTTFGTSVVYDSIIHVYDVTVNYSTAETIIVAICDSFQVPSGIWYSTTGIYNDTIPNNVGCDSVITVDLTITTTTFIRDTVFACDSNDFRGMNLTTAGTYYDTVFTGSCDSIYVRTLTMGYASFATFTQFECDSFVSPSGKVWNTDGTYLDTIMNASGCDSNMVFNLTFGYISYSTNSVTACDSYTSPSGKVWTVSGTYLDTIVNASGCDSAMTFNLTVNYSQTATNTVFACDSYTLPDGYVTPISGTFIDTIPTSLGCDSIITSIVTIGYTTSSTISATACGSYTSPSGKVWTTSGSRFDTIVNSFGCDSLMTINLTIKANTAETRTISSCGSYTVPETGSVYTTSGTYTCLLYTSPRPRDRTRARMTSYA